MEKDAAAMPTRTWAIVAAIAVTALWSTAYVAPSAVRPASELLLVAGRYLAFGLCGVAVLIVRRREVARMSLGRILYAWHLGAVGYLVFYVSVSYAVTMAGGFVVAILVGCSPICIALAGNALEKRIPWRLFAPAVVAIALGIVVIVAGGSGSDLRVAVPPLVVVLALTASGAWTYFVVMNARALRLWPDLPSPIVWAGLVAAGAGTGSLLLLPVGLAMTPPETFRPDVLLRFAAWLAWLAIVVSWIGTWVWIRLSAHLPTALAGPLLASDPVFGAILSLAYEHRLPTAQECLGSLLVVGGVAGCLALDRAAAAAAVPRPATP